MTSSEAWFVGDRAENLAIVLLTRFPVSVRRETDNHQGLDLRVVVDPDKPGFREFGIEIKGATRISQLVDQHHRVRAAAIRASRQVLKDCPFPVALMMFDVTRDEGFFGWLLAPVVSGAQAGLTEVDPVSVEPATNETIAHALSQIRDWYKAGPWRIRKS